MRTVERWRPVPGWIGLYEVSDHGRVRSLDRVVLYPDGTMRSRAGRLLKCSPNRGYPMATLRQQDRHERMYVHKAVLLAFVGPKPSGTECSHKNGDRADPRLSNILWETRSENLRRMADHGTNFRGVDHPNNKLSESDVLDIKSRLGAGERVKDIAARYPFVNPTMVSHIKYGRAWAWLV